VKDLEEQRVCDKFSLKLGKTFTETFPMLQQAYGEDCVSRTQCHEWHQLFKSGRKSIEDEPKFGRPSTSMDDDHVEKVIAVIHQNRRLIVREVAEEVRIRTVPSGFDRQTEDASCCRKICTASADRCNPYP